MKFPVFSQLAGNFGFQRRGSLETASSSGESRKLRPPTRVPGPILRNMIGELMARARSVRRDAWAAGPGRDGETSPSGLSAYARTGRAMFLTLCSPMSSKG